MRCLQLGVGEMMVSYGRVPMFALGLFGIAARKVDFAVLGITAYLDPTISLLLGIFLYREEVDLYKAVGFITIWIGILFFTLNQFKSKRQGPEQMTEVSE